MNLKIIIFCIFIQYEVCLCLKNTAIDIPSKLYTSTTDQKNTDRQTYFYIENRHTKRGAMERLKLAIHEHVCHTFPKMREKICEQLLEFDVNGFTFSSKSEPLKCKPKSYTIQFPTLATSTESKLWIFSCPPVKYTDLESGEQRTLPYIYKVSYARTYDSAILFVQKDSKSTDIYPQKYIENIDFKQLKSNIISLSSESEAAEMTKNEIIGSYFKGKQITSPYEKFQLFHSSINVCGLRRAHRIYLCTRSIKVALRTALFPFDFLGYKETSCKKHGVFQSELNNNRVKNNPRRKNELYMFRCPPIKTEFNEYLPKSINLRYVASNLSYHSITLFARDNNKKDGVKQELDIKTLHMRPILEHIHRERFLPEPSMKMNTENTGPQKSFQEIEDELNSWCGEVRTPLTLKRLTKQNLELPKSKAEDVLQFTRDRWLGDHVLMSFSKVKMTTSIYRRFMMTHKSIEICHLTMLQRMLLCNMALKDLRFSGEEYLFDTKLYTTCSRQKVILTALEADDYETNQFSMWECPNNSRNRRVYFVGKNHLRDSATIYRRTELRGQEEYYYPHTLITKIDRYKLVDDTILRIRVINYN